MTSTPPDPLFSVRTALVLLLAVITGAAAGILTFLMTFSVPASVLAGGSAWGAGLVLFHMIIGK